MTTAAHNPFRSERIDSLAFRDTRWNLPKLLARLDTLAGRGMVVGPHGTGKTTLLDGFAAHMESAGRAVVRIRADRAGPTALIRNRRTCVGAAVLIDGLDTWPRSAARCLAIATRRAACVVATSHRPGPLPLLLGTASDPDLVRSLLQDLGVRPPSDLDRLLAVHGGNVRDVFRTLYDRVASLPRVAATREDPVPSRP